MHLSDGMQPHDGALKPGPELLVIMDQSRSHKDCSGVALDSHSSAATGLSCSLNTHAYKVSLCFLI